MNRLAHYVVATGLFMGTAQAAPLLSTDASTSYHRVQVDDVGIFYRQGSCPAAWCRSVPLSSVGCLISSPVLAC